MVGAGVNAKKVTHEFWIEKISEEKLRLAEDQAKAAQKAANEAKMAEAGILKNWFQWKLNTLNHLNIVLRWINYKF